MILHGQLSSFHFSFYIRFVRIDRRDKENKSWMLAFKTNAIISISMSTKYKTN